MNMRATRRAHQLPSPVLPVLSEVEGKEAEGIVVEGNLVDGPKGETAEMAGRITNIQRFSVQDGPGIRTTVFFQGCPLSCPWCHNPETHDGVPAVWVMPNRCIRCRACVTVCPVIEDPQEFTIQDQVPDSCLGCGACVAVCPTTARRKISRETTPKELCDAVFRDRPFYEQSGGGVTFSGGEPLVQPGFLLECLTDCRRAGLHVAVDTCGYAPLEILEDVAALTDLFLFDLKTMDESLHQSITGVPLAPILANLEALDSRGADLWLRIPLIPGFNDGDSELKTLGRYMSRLKRSHRVHLLPYHRTGINKYLRLGLSAPTTYSEPTGDAVSHAVELLEAFGLDVHLGRP